MNKVTPLRAKRRSWLSALALFLTGVLIVVGTATRGGAILARNSAALTVASTATACLPRALLSPVLAALAAEGAESTIDITGCAAVAPRGYDQMLQRLCLARASLCSVGWLSSGDYRPLLDNPSAAGEDRAVARIAAIARGYALQAAGMERAARKVWAQDAGLTAAALARIINQFWRARDIDALASAAEDLARLDPDNSEPYAVLGEMYWNSGQPEPARAAYAAAAKRETRTTMQALYEGYESVIGGNNERAVEWFERAIAADGSNWRAMVALANARLNEGQPAAAKEWLTRAHRVAPQNSDITRALQQIQGQ